MEFMSKREYEHKEKERKELESIVEKVPYSLPVALIKMCKLNRYAPLGIEKYFELISPTFHLLKRSDGSRYRSNSVKAVRAAMLSEELFYKNDEGLYELNVQNAIKHVRAMQKKKEHDDIILNEKLNAKKIKRELREKARLQKMLAKRKKVIRDELISKEEKKQKLLYHGKYGNAYKIFSNLLKLAEDNQNIYSKINLDFNNFNTINLQEDSLDYNTVIGMLTFFKLFRPFLVKNLKCVKVEEKLKEKLGELNNEIRYMQSFISSYD